MEEFDLSLKISPSDKEFRKLIGEEAYAQVYTETLKLNNHSCRGCGFRPLDENKIPHALSLHVIEINQEEPLKSPCAILCRACHFTQHIDVAIEKEWVQLVNSTHTQKALISMCRTNAILSSVQEDNTRYLKTQPKDFLEKIKAGTLIHTKAKVIFTNKFEWGDL